MKPMRPSWLLAPIAEPEEHLLAPAEEVALGDVEGAEEAVEASCSRAPMLKSPVALSVTSTLTTILSGRRAGLGGDVHLVEVAQVEQPLAAPHQLLVREQLALGHAELAAQDLLRALRVAADVDPLDVDLGPLDDRRR